MNKKGIIFDIQRFSLHDGPGIRTTVFFKGCPLRCLWCHNPESQQMKPQLMYNKEKCTNCLACISECPTGAHKVSDNVHTLDRSLCKENLKCVKVCAYNALKAVGFEADVLSILNEVMADFDYYKNSGGGLTVSGGEPMLQHEFLKELLKSAKERNIHTCIETCGYSEQDNYKQVVDLTDIFLFDIKSVESTMHKKLTGVTNEIILSNLDFLYRNNASIILRCPLIPGVNDSDSNLEGIAELERKYPGLKGIEIMPYHDLGKGKWAEAGFEYMLSCLGNTSEETKNLWIDKLHKMGCIRAVLS